MKLFLYSIIAFIFMLPALNYAGYRLHTTSTFYGECVGVTEQEDSNLLYEVNKHNLILSIIFFESVLAPTMIVANDLYCPIGRK